MAPAGEEESRKKKEEKKKDERRKEVEARGYKKEKGKGCRKARG